MLQLLQVLTAEQQEKRDFDKDLQKPCSQLLLVANKLIIQMVAITWGCKLWLQKPVLLRGTCKNPKSHYKRPYMATFLHFCICLSTFPSMLPGHDDWAWKNPQSAGSVAQQAMSQATISHAFSSFHWRLGFAKWSLRANPLKNAKLHWLTVLFKWRTLWCAFCCCVYSVVVWIFFFGAFRNGIKPSRVLRLFSPAMNVVTYLDVVVTLQQLSTSL